LAASLLRLQQQTPYNQPNEWVFASMKTRRRSPVWLNTLMDDHVQPAVVGAKVQKRVTWHIFRRTLATLLKVHRTSAQPMEGLSTRSSPHRTRAEARQCTENKGQ
jgi:integrase